ncbi:hypothetical protein BBP40_000951 [Aspergillus hancockii]|nr:hypothetical protein BBP40_000951 [Aspergillus hancockii]
MCPRQLANDYFAPLVERFVKDNSPTQSRLSISREDFIAMQVYGEGLEAGQRVLELTSPLAMAGIKTQVIETLEKRGFQFEMSTDTFINNNQFNNCLSPLSSRSASSLGSPPATPPPSSLDELQSRTFSSLRKHNIIPSVDKSLRLVQCAVHHRDSDEASSVSILRDALTVALVVDKPRFLSLTMTAADPAASLLLEQRLLPRFSSDPTLPAEPDDETSLLLGSKEEILVPIMLDLRKLPLEASGIVCGVASRLADATHGRGDDITDGSSTILSHSWNGASSFESSIDRFFSTSVGSGGPVKPPTPGSGRKSTSNNNLTHYLQPDLDNYADAVEISFLSTARAGTIVVGEHELQRAVDALEAESHEPEQFGDLEI